MIKAKNQYANYHPATLQLAISKSMVQCHGGEITVKNNPDRGSEFIITIKQKLN